jgi:electron transport complex protein RnfA
MVMATAVTFPIFIFVLAPQGLIFLRILVFVLVIATLVQLVEYFLKKMIPSLYGAMGIYLVLITVNCAIFAVTYEAIDVYAIAFGTPEFSFIVSFTQSIVYAIGVSMGFMVAMILLAGIRERIQTAPVPAFLKGTPVLFAATALLSVAFMGFNGLI